MTTPPRIDGLEKAIFIVGSGYDWDDCTCASEYRDSMKKLLKAARAWLEVQEGVDLEALKREILASHEELDYQEQYELSVGAIGWVLSLLASRGLITAKPKSGSEGG